MVLVFKGYEFRKSNQYVADIVGKTVFIYLNGDIYKSVVYSSLLGPAVYEIMGETYGASRLTLYEDHGSYCVVVS